MRRLALIVCLGALAGAPAAWPAGVPGGSVAGIAFHDVNGDGIAQAGEAGLAGWIVWADLDLNGARDGAEPSSVVAADGRYTLGPLPGGQYTLRIQSPDGASCAPGAICSKPASVTDGAQTTIDFAIASAGEPGRQLIDGNPARIGPVKLAVRRGCARRPFVAVLTGPGVTRVDFLLDGRSLHSVRKPDRLGRWTIRIDPRGLAHGRHSLGAAVWFSRIAKAPSKQVAATFRSCA
jgi:hypothetical protein